MQLLREHRKSASSLFWLRGKIYVFSMGRGKWRVELVDSHHFKPAHIKGRARAFTLSDSHPYRGGATNRSVVRSFALRNIDPPPREESPVGVHFSETNQITFENLNNNGIRSQDYWITDTIAIRLLQILCSEIGINNINKIGIFFSFTERSLICFARIFKIKEECKRIATAALVFSSWRS